MSIEVKVAVKVGYNFAIVDKSEVRGIKLKPSHTLVKVGDEIYPLNSGETYEDSRKLDDILDCNTEYSISEYQVN